MIFQNSPFELLDKAFKTLYPNKRYMAYIDLRYTICMDL